MKDEEQIAGKAEDDPLAQSANFQDRLALRRGDWRIDRAQQKRAGQTDFLERLSEHARAERVDVDENVGKLGHG